MQNKKESILKDPKKSTWKTIKLWPGNTAYIIGGGPSIKNANLDLIKNKRVIGVNNAYQLGDWVDICWFGDTRWYYWHQERLRKFGGMIAHCSAVKLPYLKRLGRSSKRLGIDKDPSKVCWCLHSGGSAINFAYHLGVKRIVLLGFDMRRVEVDGFSKSNWHDSHPNSETKNPYEKFLTSFAPIDNDAKKLGLEILNATPGSTIKEFPFVRLEDVV